MTKRIAIFFIALLTFAGLHAQSAQQARQTLDKAASVIGRKGGASAKFSMSNAKLGSTNGTIAIKGNKFMATTPEAVVWYDGKTQWTYMPSTDEVNITSPTKEQQAAINPYTFINIYKKGYNLSMQTKGNSQIVTMKAQNGKQALQQMVITVNKATSVPSQVKMQQNGEWTTISISNFQAKDQADNTFVFNPKKYPTAELIDLR